MTRKDFITKMLELGAELDQADNDVQCNMIINEAEMVVNTFIKADPANGVIADKQTTELYNVLSAVPYQLCPKCGGDGQVLVNEWNGSETSITSEVQKCNLCKGEKIIPMHLIPTVPIQNVNGLLPSKYTGLLVAAKKAYSAIRHETNPSNSQLEAYFDIEKAIKAIEEQ